MQKILFALIATLIAFSLPSPVAAKSLKGSLTDLVKKNQSLKCTYTMKIAKNQKVKGTIYTSKGKFRSEFKMPYPNQKSNITYSLSDGTNLYMWNSSNKMGTQMNLKKMAQLGKNQTNNAEAKKSAEQLKKEYKYNCSSWNAQGNFFKLPSDVSFTDLTEMMEGLEGLGNKLQKQAGSLEQDTCNICESLPSTVKNKCLESCK